MGFFSEDRYTVEVTCHPSEGSFYSATIKTVLKTNNLDEAIKVCEQQEWRSYIQDTHSSTAHSNNGKKIYPRDD
jgi:hypothetical protein